MPKRVNVDLLSLAKLRTLAVIAAVSAIMPAMEPAGAQVFVFDPSNYGQNTLTAARELDQINNQVKSLENEAQMLINGAKSLTALPTSVVGQLTGKINEINGLIAQAKGLTFDVAKTTDGFDRNYPRQYTASSSADQMLQDASTRWDNTYQALRQSLLTQSTVSSALDQDGQTLQTLMATSSSAIGALQAHQAGNELLALSVKQSLQAQALAAAQARAEATQFAEEQASAAAAQERFVRFIGDGHAYSGH